MEKILVLGGSYLQSDFVEDAIALGYEVVCIDRDNDCYMKHKLPQNFDNVDFGDIEILRNYIKTGKFNAIIAPANELGNLLISQLAPEFGLKYNSLETVMSTIDKGLLKTLLKKLKINTPELYSIENITEINYPVIVKPSNSSAGRGVSLVKTQIELNNAIQDAELYVKKEGSVLIEEYIEGEQYSIETISCNSKHYIVGITQETTTGIPFFIERSHYTSPQIFNKKFLFIDFINHLLNSLGVKYGPCHIEVIVNNKEEIYPIDFGTRSGGFRSRLLKYAGGSNYNKLIMDSYTKKQINTNDIKEPSRTSTVSLLLYPRDLEIYLEAKKDGNLVEEFFYPRGPELNPCNIMHAFGYFFGAYNGEEFKYKL